ncbi:hypothetical protein [Nocardia jinanensis]|nr:hypothetical protein [Nocardia jinanensis]
MAKKNVQGWVHADVIGSGVEARGYGGAVSARGRRVDELVAAGTGQVSVR